ncbi:condensation domain-containing protein [Streptosporangium sp. CA-135522]|uniref:condensation domain-containing protein n=1 Tax=Streptosporangium sp. CA-135522 TaxID=3240072 RepID=UPI003D8C04B2
MSHAPFDLRGIPLALHLNGPLDVPALLGACAAVAARHPVLGRARVVRVDSSPARYPELAAAEVACPFDPDRGPLARFTLAGLGRDRNRLIFTAHGTVFDGASKDLLLRDLADAYFSRAPLPRLAAPYGEQRPEDGGAGVFWKERDREPAELVLPGLRANPGGVGPGEIIEMVLGGAEFKAFVGAAATLGATRFELLVAAVGVLLRGYGTTGSPLALALGTRTGETRHHIGNFVAEVPFVPCPEPGEGFPAHLRAVRAELRELYRFRHAPPAATSAPVLLGYRRRVSAPRFPGLGTGVEWTVFNGTARGALQVQAVDGDMSLTLGLRFNPTALGHDDVARIAGDLRALLRTIATEPHARVADLPPARPEPGEELR